MPLNVIGLLNISIGFEEYVVNQNVKLLSREYFESQHIVLPPDVRFYKTFIVSNCDFEKDISNVSAEKKPFLPIYLLWAIRLYLNNIEIINSSWFSGDTFEKLGEFSKIPSISTFKVSNKASNKSSNILDMFKIDNYLQAIDDSTLGDIMILYKKIVALYQTQEQALDKINLDWLFAFTKFQDCCAEIEPFEFVRNVTSALEFLLVNTSDESNYRAALFTSLIYGNDLKVRSACFDFMRWAYSVRTQLSGMDSFQARAFVDKIQLPEVLLKLKEILAVVLLETIGLPSAELQQKLYKMILSCPKLS